ncbi:MAG: patatin-like phospholipase family protein [Bacteroides sp.]|nr:patatin-like phospholipase family protein [Bacteroides sp.]
MISNLPSALYAQERKKVAVVLSGGGAKGAAHIGALKVIEEAGIPVDYVVGTSMGAIIGGLYAIGYTPHQMDSLVKAQDWPFVLSDKIRRQDESIPEREDSEKYLYTLSFRKSLKEAGDGGIIRGQNIDNLLSTLTIGYHDSIDFNRLPIPFACVSEDVVEGKQIVFQSGELPKAMRASMAIPGVFAPIRMNNWVLVDGGMTNNYPTDVAKKLGADIIIGVDLQTPPLTADELVGVGDILGQILKLTTQNNHDENVALTDTYILVDVEGYSTASFSPAAMDSLTHRGEKAAREKWDQLTALKSKIGIPASYQPQRPAPYQSVFQDDSKIPVRSVVLDGVDTSDQRYLLHRSGLKNNSMVGLEQIEKAVSVMCGSQSYIGGAYQLHETPDGYILRFPLQERTEKDLRVGLRFDTEEMAALLFNASLRMRTRIPSTLSGTLRVGKRVSANLDYSLELFRLKDLELSYMYQYNDINVYNKGSRAYNTTYNFHTATFRITDIHQSNMIYGAGLNWEYYDYNKLLVEEGEEEIHVSSDHYLNYTAFFHYDNFDKRYFPEKGQSVRVNAALYTDNLIGYKGSAPFGSVMAGWSGAFSPTKRFTMLPSVYGRVLIGNRVPYAYKNMIGGDVFGHYFPQQLPFTGVNHVEATENALTIVGLKLRRRLWEKHYVTLTGNAGWNNNDFFKLFSGEKLYGVSGSYGINTLFGPLQGTISYSNRTKKAGFYISLGYDF